MPGYFFSFPTGIVRIYFMLAGEEKNNGFCFCCVFEKG